MNIGKYLKMKDYVKTKRSIIIFYVEKSKKFLGFHKFNYLSCRNNTNILALGGICEGNIHKLKLLNIKGFGGIRMFKKKTGLLKAGFYKD